MPRFRRVAGEEAGPEALGILVPPGRRTMIILRPRSLDWDLLPLKPGAGAADPNPFWQTDRDHAATVAEKLARALEDDPDNAAHSEAAPTGFIVSAEVGLLPLVVCSRRPGQAYQPLLFATREEADTAARQLSAVLSPATGAGRELYLNSQHFAR